MIKNIVRDVVSDIVKTVSADAVVDAKPLAWYDAADASTITESGGLVSAWADKSGNGYDVSQGTGASQPTFLGVDKGVRFQSDFMSSSGSNIGSKDISCFVVCDVNSAATFDYLFGTDGVNNNGSLILGTFTTVDLWVFSTGGDSPYFDLPLSEASSGTILLEGTKNQTEITLRKNGVLLPIDTVNFGTDVIDTANNFVLGSAYNASSNNMADVTIKEVILLPKLNDTERESIQDYLTQKWINSYTPLRHNPEMWVDATDSNFIVESGGLVSQLTDKSPNGNPALQITAAFQPTLNTAGDYSYLEFDNVNDTLTYDVGTFDGQIGIATKSGTYVADCSYTGAFSMPVYQPFDIVMIVIANTINENDFKNYAVNRGAVAGFGGVGDFRYAFRGRSDLTSIPIIDISSVTYMWASWYGCSSLTSFPLLDTSSAKNMGYTWYACSSLTSFPLIDTSSVTNMAYTWHTCSSLTSFPLINTSSVDDMNNAWRDCSGLTSFPLLNTSSVTNISVAWRGCTSLTSFPLIDTSLVDNFGQTWYGCSSLVSFPAINTSSSTNFNYAWQNCTSLTTFPANVFDSTPCTSFTSAFHNTALTETSIDNILVSINTAGTSSGTFNQSGGSAPSATGEAAITAMRSRGWTVTVTGGF